MTPFSMLRDGLVLAALLVPLGGSVAAHGRDPTWPVWDTRSAEVPTGIIVLGGGLHTYLHNRANHAPIPGPGLRITAAIALARRYPAAMLLHTGYEAPPGAGPVLQEAGIDPARNTIEARSRTTAQNALFSAALVHPRPTDRWILVTSADHMRRAMACFRSAGFSVEAYPVDPGSLTGAGERSAWHEYLGTLAYRLLGRCRRGASAP